MAAWHVSPNKLSTILMPERVLSSYVRSSTSEAAKPGMQSVSLNARLRIVTLSASTSMREYPVNVAAPCRPALVSIVSDFVMSRTVSSYVPVGTATLPPGAALSIMICRAGRGIASTTYACGVHCGSTYTAPLDGSRPSAPTWLLTDARPVRLWVSALTTATRGLAKS